ncbi:DUF2252 domain-containing protein [Enhydrobacter sp.]|jgi:uncharacterized protein (DUF2252 family)|uniref:DUF2252 domain-containing protein n=1 Tax=Enhydrobacter sp. TaxID=1894999 RepID=UPI0026178164|nr:DUF2252 domain-containing protein [Enhydrobacter sp.]WIM09258.1 MAG: hypothetical protein OJF58_000209 [Enhydrobacter sp.]
MTITDLRTHVDQTLSRLASPDSARSLSESFVAPRSSVAERLEQGRQLRKKVARADHAAFEPRGDWADPVDILERQNRTRVQKLVPVRYARMLASPFAYLRGSAAVMAADLASTPASGLAVAACGDMHVSNFGVFASAERNLVFAINDFDEVHPGPWEWDLKRLAASAAVAVRFRGGDKPAAERAARATVCSYRRRMRRYAGMGHLQVWYARIDERAVLDVLTPRAGKVARQVMDKARQKNHVAVLEKLTEQVDGEPRIIEDVPLIVRETHTDAGTPARVALDRVLRSYAASLGLDRRVLLARYRIVDVVRKVVGVGSVGTACWVVMLQGVDGDDPLFLQVKEAQASVLAPYVVHDFPFANQGQRVVVGQRLTQGSPDIFLGWGEADGKDLYVRQLADMKGGIKFTEGDDRDLDGFVEYCGLCGWALALAHAKSGDPAMIAGYCGRGAALDEAIGKFAMAYLKQTERDHDALAAARRSGRIRVASEHIAG